MTSGPRDQFPSDVVRVLELLDQVAAVSVQSSDETANAEAMAELRLVDRRVAVVPVLVQSDALLENDSAVRVEASQNSDILRRT